MAKKNSRKMRKEQNAKVQSSAPSVACNVSMPSSASPKVQKTSKKKKKHLQKNNTPANKRQVQLTAASILISEAKSVTKVQSTDVVKKGTSIHRLEKSKHVKPQGVFRRVSQSDPKIAISRSAATTKKNVNHIRSRSIFKFLRVPLTLIVRSRLYALFTSATTVIVLAIAVSMIIILSSSDNSAISADLGLAVGTAPKQNETEQITVSSDSYYRVVAYTELEEATATFGRSMRITEIDKANSSKYAPLPTYSLKSYKTVRFGDTEKRVKLIQQRLCELGFLSIDEYTDYFGPATNRAVKAFQRQHNLTQTGNANKKTLKLMFSDKAEYRYLMEGDEGDEIYELQEQLYSLAYLDSITGFFGSLTKEAVMNFQTNNSLNATGIADHTTVALMYTPNVVPGAGYEKLQRRLAKTQLFIDTARAQLGKHYSLGSHGPRYFDCSGLVYYCLSTAGSNRHRMSAQGYSQVSSWDKIESMSSMLPGDLIFFYNDYHSRIGHVGIYVGGGMMIDASTSENAVVYRPCRTSHWRHLFAFARRPW